MKNLLTYHKKNLRSFSKVTQARLINLLFFILLIELYSPIITAYKGIYLIIGDFKPETIIAIFGLITLVSQKFYKYILKHFNYSNIVKLLMIINILWIVGSLLYFVNPAYMIWWDSFLGIIDAVAYLVISTANTNYMNYLESKDFTKFNNYKNDLWIEVAMIGMLLSALITYFLSIKVSIILIIILGCIIVIWQYKTLYLYKEKDFLYLLNYHRGLKKKRK